MLQIIPSLEEIGNLVGENAYGAWIAISRIIKSHYDMDELWDKGGKAWNYEYKFRKSGKTLCALYAKKDCAGIMIIFGHDERKKFETKREQFSAETQKLYDEAKTFHDGKWVMFPLDYSVSPVDLEQLLFIKRKPNKKLLNGAEHYSLSDIRADIRNGKNIMTNDILCTYKRKTTIDKQTFKFTFEFDLTKDITEGDLADMILYCCQGDLRMQEILSKCPFNDETKINDLIIIANEYRKKLLEDETN